MQLAPHCPMFYSWLFIIRAPLKKVRPHSGQARPPCLTYPSAWQERLPQEVFQKTSNSGTIDSFARSTWIPAYIFPESPRKRRRKRRRQRGESVRESEPAHGIMKSWMIDGAKVLFMFVRFLTSTGRAVFRCTESQWGKLTRIWWLIDFIE